VDVAPSATSVGGGVWVLAAGGADVGLDLQPHTVAVERRAIVAAKPAAATNEAEDMPIGHTSS